MFGPLLLGRLWTDMDQIWQEGQGALRIGAYVIGFHGNQTVVMVSNENRPVPLIWGLW